MRQDVPREAVASVVSFDVYIDGLIAWCMLLVATACDGTHHDSRASFDGQYSGKTCEQSGPYLHSQLCPTASCELVQ